jgi:thioredoxin-related protein
MAPSVRRVEALYQDRVDFHILNVDRPMTTPLRREFQVPGVPTIVLLDAEGEVFRKIVGYQTEEQLVTAIEALLAAE